jgi:hypothetical protein
MLPQILASNVFLDQYPIQLELDAFVLTLIYHGVLPQINVIAVLLQQYYKQMVLALNVHQIH